MCMIDAIELTYVREDVPFHLRSLYIADIIGFNSHLSRDVSRQITSAVCTFLETINAKI